jgi:hypothetical protein
VRFRKRRKNKRAWLIFLANIRQAIIVICYLLKPVLVKNYTRMVTQMGANANKIKFENLLSDEIDSCKNCNKRKLFLKDWNKTH